VIGQTCRAFIPCRSAFIVVNRECGSFLGVADPYNLNVAKRFRLIELDEALLEQLQQREEAHDDLQPLDKTCRQPSERDATGARQFIE